MSRLEPYLGVLLALAYVGWLLATMSSLGYARDEGFYFYAAGRYAAWFEMLWATPERALDWEVIDYHWSVNREHPPLMKVLFALSHGLFHERLAWISSSGTAYRAVGALMAGVALCTQYAWARRVAGPVAGVAAVLALGLMPRFFYHAHLACFDVPVASLWLLTAFAYSRALQDGRKRWLLVTALLYGGLLSTKHNAWLLPPVLVVHLVLLLGFGYRGMARNAARVIACMLLLGPLVFYASWPWIWHDTWQRVREYVAFHMGHEYYNMEFLGQTYHRPPMPRLYAPVMTLATVPSIVLVLFGLGALGSACILTTAWLGRQKWELARIRDWCSRFPAKNAGSELPNATLATLLLWLLALLASYAPWLSSDTPIFGGTKHWITAYPFMALLAGLGFRWTIDAIHRSLTTPRARTLSTAVVAAVALAPPLVMTLGSHPFGLSFYTPLVGGAPGAANLGLNRSFWGYTTGSLQSPINDHAPLGSALYLHDTATASFQMLERDGRIRSDIRGSLDIASSELALYHHEPHMRRVEFQIWANYGTVSPLAVATYQGVPVAWLYQRPHRR